MISAISLRSALADRPVSDLHLSEWSRRTESPGRRWLAPLPLSLSAPYTDHHRHTWITPTLPLKPPTTISYSRKKQHQLHISPGFLGLSFPLMAHTLGDTLKNKQMAKIFLIHTQKWLWHVFFTNRPCALHSMHRSGAPYSRCQYPPSLFYQS